MDSAFVVVAAAIALFVMFYAARTVIGWVWDDEKAKENSQKFAFFVGGIFALGGILVGIRNFSLSAVFWGYVIAAVIIGIAWLAEFTWNIRATVKADAIAAESRHLQDLRRQKEEEDERQRRETEEKKAREQHEQLEAEKAKLRTKRDEAVGQQALHGHMAVIVGAVRALRLDGENAVLLNTIDGEVKSIGRSEKITETMLKNAEIQEEISLVLARLDDLKISDKILTNRIQRTFRLNGIDKQAI